MIKKARIFTQWLLNRNKEQNVDYMIFDVHSHIGDEYYSQKPAVIAEYQEFAKAIGVSHALLMPMATPLLKKGGKSKVVLYWEYQNGHFRYISDIYKCNEIQNPYLQINEVIKQEVDNYTNLSLKLEFVPLIHPLFDEISYIKGLLDQTPLAVKIHCLGAGITPEQVKPEILRLLSNRGTPVIVHVDHDECGFSATAGMRYLRSKNGALEWCKLFLKYDVIGIITHGACLKPEALTMISKNSNLYCGIGPDLYMGSNPQRLGINRQELYLHGFLGVIKKYVSADKLLFDLDYNFNKERKSEDDCDSLEWELPMRVRSVWNEHDAQKILYLNAKKLFRI